MQTVRWKGPKSVEVCGALDSERESGLCAPRSISGTPGSSFSIGVALDVFGMKLTVEGGSGSREDRGRATGESVETREALKLPQHSADAGEEWADRWEKEKAIRTHATVES